MLQYIIPFAGYILPALFIKDAGLSYAIRIGITALLLIFFWRKYKLKFRVTPIALAAGFITAVIWITLPYSMSKSVFHPAGIFMIAKIIGFCLIVPIIEELFTRDFMIRMTIALEKKKVIEDIKIGTFTLISAIVSILFFGLSHYMIAAGILSAIILNALLYQTKRIEDCIAAHAAANILVALYVFYTGYWFLW